MKLKKLVLNNFQGIKFFEFLIDGQNASVFGSNATGKTTLFNAYTWLLFDKASTGAKNFSPKTKAPDGSDVHNLEHSVTGVFDLGEREVTFQKSLRENWVKKRGSKTEEFSGHVTDYKIDGVPATKCEYDKTISEILPQSRMPILTQPFYFAESMNWQERRKLLLEVCGDISDEDVLKSSPELNELERFLSNNDKQRYSVEKYIRLAKSKLADINKALESLPTRIDEAQKAIPDVSGIDSKSVIKNVSAIQEKIDKLSEDKQAMNVTSANTTLYQEIAQIKAQLAESQAKFLEMYNLSVSEKREEIDALEAKLNEYNKSKRKLETEQVCKSDALRNMKSRRAKLVGDYEAEKSTVYKGESCCPTCGQDLPVEQIQEARARFNEQKTERLLAIRDEIENTCSKVMIATLEKELEAIKKQVDKLEVTIKECESELSEKRSNIPEKPDYSKTDEYKSYVEQIAALQQMINNGNSNVSKHIEAIQGKMDALNKVLKEEQNKLFMLSMAESQNKRIKQLEKEQKQLTKEYEDLQHGIYLCEQFTKKKVAMLDNKINSKFSSVKFRLFQEQINGGIREDCEVMIPTDDGRLVPFAFSNNAGRINAGLEIIDTLSAHWNIQIPVFVDNAESVVDLKPIKPQLIRLVVSGHDKKLRVVKDTVYLTQANVLKMAR